jgi:hypothetical protein
MVNNRFPLDPNAPIPFPCTACVLLDRQVVDLTIRESAEDEMGDVVKKRALKPRWRVEG